MPAANLPALVAGHDVCLGIFGTGDKALRVVPNKVFQGAAAGCAIVTSDTAPQRRALGDAAVLVPPGDPEALAAALRGWPMTARTGPAAPAGPQPGPAAIRGDPDRGPAGRASADGEAAVHDPMRAPRSRDLQEEELGMVQE